MSCNTCKDKGNVTPDNKEQKVKGNVVEKSFNRKSPFIFRFLGFLMILVGLPILLLVITLYLAINLLLGKKSIDPVSMGEKYKTNNKSENKPYKDENNGYIIEEVEESNE